MRTLFTDDELKKAVEDPKSGTGTGFGLYRNGYRMHGQDFWGMKPGSEVLRFLDMVTSIQWNACSVLEIGAGTGKNILEFVRQDAMRAVAVEIDSLAVSELLNILVRLEEAGLVPEGKLAIVKDDALNFLRHNKEQFDIVICYGFLHVFKKQDQLQEVIDLISGTVQNDGYLILQSLTDKYPAPLSQSELEGVIVTSEFVKQSFKPGIWNTLHWNEEDIVHSHAGSEKDHRHGSVRVIFKHSISS